MEVMQLVMTTIKKLRLCDLSVFCWFLVIERWSYSPYQVAVDGHIKAVLDILHKFAFHNAFYVPH